MKTALSLYSIDDLNYMELLMVMAEQNDNSCYFSLGGRLVSYMEVAEKILYLLREKEANESV